MGHDDDVLRFDLLVNDPVLVKVGLHDGREDEEAALLGPRNDLGHGRADGGIADLKFDWRIICC